MESNTTRRLVVWCPDWPVVAARAAESAGSEPAAVLHANRVLACSGTARAAGVTRGMRRREAQGRCPELVVHAHDPDRDARAFEPVARAVEALAPGVEVVRPGLLAVPSRGPARYFGTEEAFAERVIDAVAAQAGVECQTGIGDGLFTAILAARRGVIVAEGGGRRFLAPLSLTELNQPVDPRAVDPKAVAPKAVDPKNSRGELVDLLWRLGIRTLGAFAALPSGDIATRFGAEAVLAHRAARGEEERPPDRRIPPPDIVVTEELDPPLDRVDTAAFIAKSLAERLHDQLAALGLACVRLGVLARTEHGEQRHRIWRCAQPLTPSGTADRVRWQLDGWLNDQSGTGAPTAGVRVLSLVPEEVVSAGGLQLDLLSSATGLADDRAHRAFVRVQGMLGPEAVVTGVLGGGRDVRDGVTFVPWGERREPTLPTDRPWPGRLPAPSPSMVPEAPWRVAVLDAEGVPVTVSDRAELSAAPVRLLPADGRTRWVRAWAGPWPVEERWWCDPEAVAGRPPRRVVRLQVVLVDADPDESTVDKQEESAVLLVLENDAWWVQGVYR